jgi:ubiquinone/menaquinone biosynthesis C-methylase UbiE
VLATDVSASMLQVARDAVREAGLGNVQTRTLAAEQMSELEARSFDAAIARFSLQFVGDVGRALAGVRRALKPGGRFAAVVFSAVEKNPSARRHRRSPVAWPVGRSLNRGPVSGHSTIR